MVTGDACAAAFCGGGRGDTVRRQRRRPAALGQPGGGQGDSRKRGGERNRRERSRWLWIAAAAITGEQKRENTTRRRGFDSKGLEHLRGSRNPFPASDWVERHREGLATRGGLRNRA
ncbi:hypothetical protein [Oryza sativa Japonica Group]|uniref:Uncharacterized protein P0041E11.24 n=1 Tax=Oryza sativa subsp. japonica TaxID=39947 RepID=Q5ZEK9_ORYSJ|nr:hypothetical protein [Oryza sativa Japonica Group]